MVNIVYLNFRKVFGLNPIKFLWTNVNMVIQSDALSLWSGEGHGVLNNGYMSLWVDASDTSWGS